MYTQNAQDSRNPIVRYSVLEVLELCAVRRLLNKNDEVTDFAEQGGRVQLGDFLD